MRLGSGRGSDGKSKELIGFISSFALTFGIAVGSCIAPAFSGWLSEEKGKKKKPKRLFLNKQ